MNYQAYLQTDYWKNVALEVKRRAGFKCQVCNSPHDLQAHHRTYKNRGNELKHLEDLTCLCDRCHGMYHQKEKVERKEGKVEKKKVMLADPELTGWGVVVTEQTALFLTIRQPAYDWLRVNGYKPQRKGWKKRLMGKWVPMLCVRPNSRKSVKTFGLVVRRG